MQHAVRIGAGGNAVTARLIIARKPPEATARQHRKLRRKASPKVTGRTHARCWRRAC